MVYTASQIIADYISPLNNSKYIIKDTTTFPNILAENPIKEDEEDISYDVVSLFTNVPVEETIEYILDEIYAKKSLKPICPSRLIMKRFLKRLATDCLFSINGRLIKQQDGCSMGSPLSVAMAGIFMTKLEKEVVYPVNPILFRRYVDDIYYRKKKNTEDILLPKLNAYHQKIKFTVEIDLQTFLDSKIRLEDGKYQTSVNRNKKLPTHWTSKIPKKIKRNNISNDLHRARKISSDFENEIKEIKKKYEKANYPLRFVESIVRDFKNKENIVVNQAEKEKEKEKENKKPLLMLRIPYCEKNEKIAGHFLQKLKDFTGNDYRFSILWQMRKIKTLLKLKDQVQHKANVVY